MRKKIEIEVSETKETTVTKTETTTDQELESLLSDWALARKVASIDLETIPYHSKPGFAVAAEQAKQKLNVLSEKVFSHLVPNNVCAVFLEGDTASLGKAETVDGGVLFRADKLYSDMANGIEYAIDSRRRLMVDNWLTLTDLLEDAHRDLLPDEFVDYNLPEYEDVHVPTTKSLVAHIRKVVRQAVGDKLTLAALKRAIIQQAVANKLTTVPVVVIVVGATKEEQETLKPQFKTTKTQTLKFSDTLANLLKG